MLLPETESLSRVAVDGGRRKNRQVGRREPGIDASQGTIYIPYIDAEDGTPVLDLKPYHPAVDRIRAVQVPAWCRHWPQWYEDSAEFDWAAEFVNAQ